jgi:hypothetical protein
MAERAQYSFPRGNKTINGPSIDSAREIARIWGNMRHGSGIVAEEGDKVHIRGFAHDLETNNYAAFEDKFSKKVQRKDRDGNPVWRDADERELRELVGKRGSILIRNAIFEILPRDLVDEAMNKANETMTKAARGELTQSREEAVRRLAVAFDSIGVTTDMLSKRLGHDLALLAEDELVDLRKVFASIRDGNSRREEHFDLKGGSVADLESVANLNDAINAGKRGAKK